MKIPLLIASDFSGVLDQLFLGACSFLAGLLAVILFVMGAFKKSRAWSRRVAFFSIGFTALQLFVMLSYLIEIPVDHQNRTVKIAWPVMATVVSASAAFALWRSKKETPDQAAQTSGRASPRTSGQKNAHE